MAAGHGEGQVLPSQLPNRILHVARGLRSDGDGRCRVGLPGLKALFLGLSDQRAHGL